MRRYIVIYSIIGFIVGIILMILGFFVAGFGHGSYIIIDVCFTPIITAGYCLHLKEPYFLIVIFGSLYSGLIGYFIGAKKAVASACVLALNYVSLIFIYLFMYVDHDRMMQWRKLLEVFSFSYIYKIIIILPVVVYLLVQVKLWMIVIQAVRNRRGRTVSVSDHSA